MKIVIVGGGAGGLELATKLGKSLGRKGKADVLLLDRNHTHIWKPLLHEVASGSLNADVDSISYRAHAHNNHFRFKLGTLCGLNRAEKSIQLAALYDEDGKEILPERSESYDLLVLAIGSVSNDFGVEGIAEHCIFLDSPRQADRFHTRLVNRFIRLNRDLREGFTDKTLNIAIVGAGATGVELSAELFKAREWFATYGLNHIKPEHLKVSLVEAGPRVLPALSDKISAAVHKELDKLGVEVRTSTIVQRAEASALVTKDDEPINADLMVWAAGVKAPEFLTQLDGLETNRANQLLVDDHLRVQGTNDVFAIGDCAGCSMKGPDGEDRWVPPRAQSAHQMASHVGDNILRLISEKPLKNFVYKDRGSLISLSHYTAVGKLMGGLTSGSLNVEGRIARAAYVSLYRMHQLALHGWMRTMLLALTDKINLLIRPRLKLH